VLGSATPPKEACRGFEASCSESGNKMRFTSIPFIKLFPELLAGKDAWKFRGQSSVAHGAGMSISAGQACQGSTSLFKFETRADPSGGCLPNSS